MLSICWGKELEKGHTSHVYLAHLGYRKVAVKVMPELEPHFKKELKIYKKLRKNPHPYIIDLLEAREHEWISRAFYNLLILEYMPQGDLVSYFIRLNRYLTEDERRTIFYETVQAVNHLHALNIMHGDIKRENILVNCDGHIKLCDFGTAKKITPELSYIQHASNVAYEGTPEYLAPETWVLFRYSKNSDMYALGILLWGICSQANTYETQTRNEPYVWTAIEVKKHVISGGRPPELPRTKISSIEKSLMHRLWAQKPEERPSVEATILDPLFKGLTPVRCDSPELNKNITSITLEPSLPEVIRRNDSVFSSDVAHASQADEERQQPQTVGHNVSALQQLSWYTHRCIERIWCCSENQSNQEQTHLLSKNSVVLR